MSELSVVNLNASYTSGILKDVTFSLCSGQLVALCGPNGCGKSTLLSVMAGVQESALKVSGAITLDGQNVAELKRRELAQNLAYMEQTENSTWNFNVSDYILQGRFAHSKNGYYSSADEAICLQVIKEVGIENLAERKVHELSGGEFQKVRIARALAQQPKFMLLDEPAASLDFVYEPQLMQMLKKFCVEKQIGIILSMHDVNLAARFVDEIIFMPPQSSIIKGTPQELMNAENLHKTFGVEFIKADSAEYFVPKL